MWLVRRYSIPIPSHGTCDPGKRRDAVRYAAIACEGARGVSAGGRLVALVLRGEGVTEADPRGREAVVEARRLREVSPNVLEVGDQVVVAADGEPRHRLLRVPAAGGGARRLGGGADGSAGVSVSSGAAVASRAASERSGSTEPVPVERSSSSLSGAACAIVLSWSCNDWLLSKACNLALQ